MTYNGFHIGGADLVWCFPLFTLIFLALAIASVVPELRKKKTGVDKATGPLMEDQSLDTGQGNGNGSIEKNL